MAIMGFNAGAEMSQLRTQQTLAMQAAAPGTPAAGPTEQSAAMAAGAAAPSGPAADAAMAGAAVQPPSTGKIVMQSVLKGAMTGVSVALGVKSFGPVLGKIGFLKGFIGALPKVGPPPVLGAGLLGFLGKVPILGKLLPMAARSGLAGFAIAALMGAAIGAIGGFFGGQKKAKAAAAEYAEAMAAQQAQQAQTPPPGDPVNVPGPVAAPAPVPPAASPKGRGKQAKTWIIARQGSTLATGGSFGNYTAHKGDTLLTLAKRFHTSIAEIKRLNPDLGDSVSAGTKLKLKRRVIPDAKPWVA